MGRAITISGGLTLLLAAATFVFLDRPITYWVFDLNWINAPALQMLTRLGDSTWYLVGSALLFGVFLLTRRRRWAQRCLFVFITIAASGLAANLLKVLFARCRPNLLIERQEYGFQFLQLGDSTLRSFPSGHACTIAALCTALYLFFPRWRYALIVVALVVASTRVMVGAHFTSDVLAGLYLGTLATFCLERLFVRRGVALRSAAATFLTPGRALTQPPR